MKKFNKKSAVIAVVLVAAIALMSFGFAAWTQTLTVEGTVNAAAAWDVKITDVAATSECAIYVDDDDDISDAEGIAACAEYSTDNVLDEAIPDGGVESVTLNTATFTKPTGYVKYTVTVTNFGTFDAQLDEDSFDFTAPDTCNSDIAEFDSPEIIAAGESCTFDFYVQVKGDEDGETDNFDALMAADGEFSITLVYDSIYEVINAPDDLAHAHA